MKDMNVKKYTDKWFNYCLMVMASIFGIFYSKFVNYSDTPLHTLVSKALFSQDSEQIIASNNLFPIHAFSYPIYHFFQKTVHAILSIDYETSAALVLSLSIVISALLYKKLILLVVENTVSNQYFADYISLGMVWFGVARCGLNDWRYYQYQCSPNPFHNPTILFVRPLAIASFIYFLQFVKTYRSKETYKYAVLFGATMLISVGAKPSCAIVLLPAMGIYTLVYMIHNRELWFGVFALIAVLPSLVLLMMQQMWVSLNTEALNINIEFGFFSGTDLFAETIVQEVLAASLVTFPVVILLFSIENMKNESVYFIAIFALVFGWLEMFFLKSGKQGDFSWGYDIAVQFATLASFIASRNSKKRGKARKVVNFIAYLTFAYQVYTGMRYLWLIYTTGEFWI